MDILGAIFILLVACVVVTSVCLGLCVGLTIKIFLHKEASEKGDEQIQKSSR